MLMTTEDDSQWFKCKNTSHDTMVIYNVQNVSVLNNVIGDISMSTIAFVSILAYLFLYWFFVSILVFSVSVFVCAYGGWHSNYSTRLQSRLVIVVTIAFY